MQARPIALGLILTALLGCLALLYLHGKDVSAAASTGDPSRAAIPATTPTAHFKPSIGSPGTAPAPAPPLNEFIEAGGEGQGVVY